MTREQLQQRAVRLLGEYHRTLKLCRAANSEERRILATVITEKARDAQQAVDAYYSAWPNRSAP